MSEATKAELEKVRKAENLAGTLLKGRHWLDWMQIAEALDIGRKIARHRAGANDPEPGDDKRLGSAYNAAFSEWLDEPDHKNLRAISASAMSWLDKCWANREAIDKWRATLTSDELLRWNHPQTVWKYFESATVVPQQESQDEEPESQDEEPEEKPAPRQREVNAATVEFVEWAVEIIKEDRIAVPTIISWLEELDVEQAIEALREYQRLNAELEPV